MPDPEFIMPPTPAEEELSKSLEEIVADAEGQAEASYRKENAKKNKEDLSSRMAAITEGYESMFSKLSASLDARRPQQERNVEQKALKAAFRKNKLKNLAIHTPGWRVALRYPVLDQDLQRSHTAQIDTGKSLIYTHFNDGEDRYLPVQYTQAFSDPRHPNDSINLVISFTPFSVNFSNKISERMIDSIKIFKDKGNKGEDKPEAILPEGIDTLLKKGSIFLSLDQDTPFVVISNKRYSFSEEEDKFRTATSNNRPISQFPPDHFLNLIQDSLSLVPTK